MLNNPRIISMQCAEAAGTAAPATSAEAA